MTSHSFFHKDLNSKITFKKPLFTIDLELSQEIKGGDETEPINETNTNNKLNYALFRNDYTLKYRFIQFLHNTYPKAILMIRNILSNQAFNYTELKKYYVAYDKQSTKSNNTTKPNQSNILMESTNTAVDILCEGKDCQLITYPFDRETKLNSISKKIYSETKSLCVIKTHNLDEDEYGFLMLWQEFEESINKRVYLHHANDIIYAMSKAGFKTHKSHIPRCNPETNPGCDMFILFKK